VSVKGVTFRPTQYS